MPLEAENKLGEIMRYPLFSQIGGSLPETVTKVTEWQHAVKACSTAKWNRRGEIARHRLQRLMQVRSWERFSTWNSIVVHIRPLIQRRVDKITVASEPLPTVVHGDVCWDLLFICLEWDFRDVVQPPYYIPMLEEWYASGHFPCGWDGPDMPEDWDGSPLEGKLMVI